MAAPRRIQASIVPAERNKVLREYFFARSDVDVIIGPLGSAKTYTTMQRILAIALDQEPNPQGVRPTKGGIIRNTWPELEQVVLKDIERFFGPMGAKITRGIPPTFSLELRLPDKTTVKLDMDFVAGLDQPDAEEKFRGYQWTWMWANEGRQIPLGVFGMGIARTGRYPSIATEGVGPTYRGAMMDTNAFDVDHPLHKLMTEPPPGWRFHVQPPGMVRLSPDHPWTVNPAREYPPDQAEDYYARVSAGRPNDWVRVNLANEFIFHVDGRPVHPQYVDAVHCAKAPLAPRKGQPLTIGVDFGRTPAATVWQYDAAMSRWTGLAEFVTENLSASLFAPTLRRWLDTEFKGFELYAWGDPAGDRSGQTVETTPVQVLRAHGIPCSPAPSNQPLLRRSALAKPMMRLCLDGRPAFVISPAMRMLRKGLQGGFHYRRIQIAGTERYTDEPDKNEYSHVVESAEYALLGGGERATRREVAYDARDEEDEPAYADMGGF
jgi:hypothetical protein